MISGSVSLLCSRCFSPFPHGTGSLSVSREYLALRDGPRRFGQDFSCPALLRCQLVLCRKCRVRDFHPLRYGFPAVSPISCRTRGAGPSTPDGALRHLRFGLLRVRSPLLTQSRLLSSPPGTEMFQFPGFASHLGVIHVSSTCGLPHSDICASQGMCPSAQLFAACHVLLRLREPRHPSCALLSFPFLFEKSLLFLILRHKESLPRPAFAHSSLPQREKERLRRALSVFVFFFMICS